MEEKSRRTSQWEFYSFAIAAQNKHLDSDIVYAMPVEVTPFMDGELDARIEEVEGSGEDHHEVEYTVKVKKDNAVKAIWMPIHNTNRRTSPDIRRGERLLLYRMSDSERFYWVSLGQDDHLRRLETVIYTWSATDREEDDATEPEHSYSFEVCTHTQQATFRTVKGITKGGGGTTEPFAYTFQFNTKEGAVILTDDVGNYIELDSAETKITLQNKDTTHVILNKENIYQYAPNSIHLEAKRDIAFLCNNFSVKAHSDITFNSTNTSIKASNSLRLSSSSMSLNTQSLSAGDATGNSISIAGAGRGGVGADVVESIGSENSPSRVEISNCRGTRLELNGNNAELEVPSAWRTFVQAEGSGGLDNHNDHINKKMGTIGNKVQPFSGSAGDDEAGYGWENDDNITRNKLYIEGSRGLMRMINNVDAKFELDGENGTIYVPKDLTVNAEQDLSVTVGRNLTLNVLEGNYSMAVGQELTMQAASKISLETPTLEFNGSPVTTW